ncbi:MAG: DegT/DnrJ/EryC1/StrS family aminotransferase [Candidatus Omnitrophota bacterium]|nr:DegT/DnrJ/EryC1/StrS family aminotransferase [Candidatus Omnitrophota bacterium]MBU1894615.1 DegT/DnrJ/EryC1/StrS family aminotransferase [Candidatus Omnitrophota bacterium]
MDIPLLDLKAQYKSIKNKIDDALMRVVESQYFVLSQEVESLEKEVADYCGALYGAGVASGTDALILAMRALGIGEGDFVITSPFTFFATSESISLLGARPLFADIDAETYNIDPNKIIKLLQSADINVRSRIKAIVPVHLYGQCADMDAITEIAEQFHLKIVEDCAQAMGAMYKGKKAGSFGSAGAFSFFPSKNLGAFGDGGIILSQDEAFIRKVKELRVHGSREMYIHEEIGYNSRLDSLQAAILRVKLLELDSWLERKRVIADKYDKAFTPLGILPPKVDENNVHTYHQYTIRLEDRDELMQYLNRKGISARVYYPVPLHLQPCYKNLGYSIGSFPISETAAEHVLSLPVYPELSEDKIDYIIQTVKSFFGS